MSAWALVLSAFASFGCSPDGEAEPAEEVAVAEPRQDAGAEAAVPSDGAAPVGDAGAAGAAGDEGAGEGDASPADGEADSDLEDAGAEPDAEPPPTDAGPDDSGSGSPEAGAPKPPPTSPPAAEARMWGVTVDDISNLSAITASLKSLAKKPTTRIVFDEFIPATTYVNAVRSIGEVSYVMGEILDSWYVSQYSVSDYDKRMVEYLDKLGDGVDIWEVGNEINGEWLCDQKASRCDAQQTKDVVAKMSGAYDRVKARGKEAALTLYYNKGCYSQSSHEMLTWAKANVPDRMKTGLDYVFVSYYEDDCNGLQPHWETVFTDLGKIFPNSRLGFGECGTEKSAKKAEYIDRYYRMKLKAPRFIGGYFWWYFKQDMVPHTKPLWGVLNQAIAGG